MGDPVPSSAISDATTGGLSVIVITGGSTGDVLTKQSDGTYAAVTPSGGVTGTGSVDNAVLRADGTGGATLQSSAIVIDDLFTASPNNTVNFVCAKPTGGTTNVGFAVVPKGTGAFALAVPTASAVGGNARGVNAVDLQTYRATAAQVASGAYSSVLGSGNTASGAYSCAVGFASVASGGRSSAFGYQATASNSNATAVGRISTASGPSALSAGAQCTASGYQSMAAGFAAVASGSNSVAVGFGVTASATASSAIGSSAKTTIASTLEVGVWSSSTVRSSAVRLHGATGMASQSLQNRSTAYTDGGATAGSEADNTLSREMYSIRRNGDVLLIDVNIGGTVKTLSLGTAT